MQKNDTQQQQQRTCVCGQSTYIHTRWCYFLHHTSSSPLSLFRFGDLFFFSLVEVRQKAETQEEEAAAAAEEDKKVRERQEGYSPLYGGRRRRRRVAIKVKEESSENIYKDKGRRRR